VIQELKAVQAPFWAYRKNKRLSCVFCIMGCENDLQHGAEQRPDLYQEYLNLEDETGWTMFNGRSLRDRVEGSSKGVQLELEIAA